MARHVGLDITLHVSINETCVDLMRFVVAMGKDSDGWADMTRAEIAEYLDKSVHTTRRACQILVEQGLLVIHTNFASNGGQNTNDYYVTPLGHRVLELVGYGTVEGA